MNGRHHTGPSPRLGVRRRFQPRSASRGWAASPYGPGSAELLDRRAARLTEGFGSLAEASASAVEPGEGPVRDPDNLITLAAARLLPFYLGTSRSSATRRRALCPILTRAHGNAVASL